MKTIGFIGLGNMGLPMALHLCQAGYPLLICSKNIESENSIIEVGGKSVSSYAEIAQKSDIIITIVPADDEVLELYTSKNGIVDNIKDGSVCIDMTSARGETKRIIASYIKEKQKNACIIDAPVSGGVVGAQSATLTIMVGCEQKHFDECMPVFEVMGKKIIRTGELGTASDTKMINQILCATHTAISCEAVCVAKKLGIDMQIMCEIINESSGGSFITKNVIPKHMLTGDHSPGFRLDLMKKDIRLFTESAKQCHSFTPISEMVYQIFTAASNNGYGDLNMTGVHKWFEDNQSW